MSEKTHELEIANQQPRAVTRATDDPVSLVAGMMEAVVQKGITQENVAAMKELAALFKDMNKLRGEQEFARAFAELQKEIPTVKAMKAVPNNDGGVRYKYAPYEKIMEQVRPLATRHGFTISFSQRFDAARVFIACTLQHASGHSRTNEFGVRIGSGPPKSSEAQGDGAAATYAKRFALCNALNIIIEADSDAGAQGPTITPEQASDLEQRIGNLGWKPDYVARWLKWAGAKTIDTISTTRFREVEAEIAKAEAKKVAALKK